jgi:hypothetical protein
MRRDHDPLVDELVAAQLRGTWQRREVARIVPGRRTLARRRVVVVRDGASVGEAGGSAVGICGLHRSGGR